MFLITLTEKTKNKHKEYFENHVVPNLTTSKTINIVPYDTKNATPIYIAENIKSTYKEFIDFILLEEDNSSRFSVGKPHELRTLKTEIEHKFSALIELLDENIVQASVGRMITLKDYILEAFGYTKFTTVTFYDLLKDVACSTLRKANYSIEVQSEMMEMLCIAFPNEKDSIEAKIPRTRLNVDEFKAKLRELSNIGIAIYNSDQIHLEGTDGVWNAYSFVFESGLRVCPYCNRQYITPILTPDGMMRADLDHILSKAKHPYLSLSLYNLLPTCQQCNQSLKGNRDTVINPYEDNINACFNFVMDEFGAIETKKLDTNPQTQEYLDMFKLQLLYNYHKNQGIELAKKRVAYPETYIAELYEKNKDYFKDETTFRELIFGLFLTEEMINTEAFSKFRRDIAGQLGIIRKEETTQLLEKLKSHLAKLG